MKLPIAQKEREQEIRIHATALLARLAPAILAKTVHLIRVGDEFPEFVVIGEALREMSMYPHSEYCVTSAGEIGVVGHDEDATEIVGRWASGRSLVEVLSPSEAK